MICVLRGACVIFSLHSERDATTLGLDKTHQLASDPHPPHSHMWRALWLYFALNSRFVCDSDMKVERPSGISNKVTSTIDLDISQMFHCRQVSAVHASIICLRILVVKCQQADFRLILNSFFTHGNAFIFTTMGRTFVLCTVYTVTKVSVFSLL